MVNERRWLVSLFILYFVLAGGYSLLMPLWEAPDEPAHFHLAWRLARKGEYATREQNYEVSQPRAYYYLAAQVIKRLDKINPRWSDYYYPKEFKFNIRVRERRFDWNETNYRFLLGVYALRWLNIIFGALALWLNWKTFQLLFSDSRARLAALALTALIPQFLHIMSSVNNDALGTLAGALLFFLSAKFINQPTSLRAFALVALAIFLPFITKLTVLPLSAAVLVIVIWKFLFSSLSWKRAIITALLLVTGIALLYLFLPDSIQSAASEISWRLLSLRANAFSANYLNRISAQIVRTFWGEVGWLAVSLPAWMIYMLSIFSILGLGFKVFARRNDSPPQLNAELWRVAWIIFLFTLAAVARNALVTSATQGRFFFPVLGALAALIVDGWWRILPSNQLKRFTAILILFLLACTIILWLTGVVPVYYQPFLG